MKGSLRPFAAGAVVFALGWIAGSGSGSARSGGPIRVSSDRAAHASGDTRPVKPGALASDRMVLSASSAEGSADLSATPSRPSIEKVLHGMPFADLKRIFLERQDEEFTRTEERYGELSRLDEAERDRRTQQLLESFQRNSEGRQYYVATAVWKLRGGRSAEVEVHTNFFSTGTTDPGTASFGKVEEAKNPRELNFFTSVYLKIDGHYSSEASGATLDAPSMHEGNPSIIVQSYSKRLTPYFDQISVPLPVLSDEASPEFYDSVTGRWTALSRLRWTSVEKDAFDRREAELRGASHED